MRVTVIPTITGYPWGAPGHCMGALVEELADAGHEVQWFVAPIDRDHAEVRRLRPRCADFHLLPAPPAVSSRWVEWCRRRLPRFGRERCLTERIDSFDPQHIFINQGGMWCALHRHDLAALLAKRPRAYSLICHLNSERPALDPRSAPPASSLLAMAKRVFVNSAYMYDLARMQLAADLPNASNYSLPHRFDFAAPLAWPVNSEAKIAFVGRLDAFHKGLDLALCALGDLKKEGVRFRFTLYGEGPDRDYLDRLAHYQGLEKDVVFAGYTESVRKVWEENEILFMPSRHEGCAVAMTEAIGFGRPVVATAVGGAPEWIDDGETGFLAAAPASRLVTDTLRRAISERSRWPEMGLAAHRKFKSHMPERPARVFLEAL